MNEEFASAPWSADTSATERQIAVALGIARQNVHKRAKKEGWKVHYQPGRGGQRRVYRISDLPADVQTALVTKALAINAPASFSEGTQRNETAQAYREGQRDGEMVRRRDAGDLGPRSGHADVEQLAARFEAAPQSRKDRAARALEIVRAWHSLRASGVLATAASQAVAGRYAVSAAKLSKLLAKVAGRPESAWLYYLLDDHCGRTATAKMSAEVWEFLKAEYLAPERRSALACIDRLRRTARAHQEWKIPSNRTLLRRIERDIPRAVKVLAREGRKAAMQLYPAQQRVRAALEALAIVNADGYKHNVWVRFPDGEVRRPQTWFWQDVYSSKILAWRTDKTEHTDAIRLSFGDLVERYGIPEVALIDNTLAAANKVMTGGSKHRFRFKVREDEPFGVFNLLGVKLSWATPGHGQAKPVERAFGHGGMGEYVDKAPECAGAWTGSSTSDKPDYDGKKQRAVALTDLQAVVEREVSAWNAREGRRSGIARGRSFNQVFEESYARTVVRRATAAQRRLWLLATEGITVGRDGTIRLDSGRMVGERRANRYWTADLIDYAGRKVIACFDPQKLHVGVEVYTADLRYIGFAECVDPAAFNDQNAAREHARNRRAFIKSTRLQLAAERRMDELETARLLAGAEVQAPAAATIKAPKVVRGEFRHPLERPRPISRPLDEEARSFMEQLEAEGAAPRPVNVHELARDTDKHRYWQALDARRATGEVLDENEARFWAGWQESPHFLIQKREDEEFERRMAERAAAAK